MKAAPGATLPPDEIFGRDAFIAMLWRTLERNSIRMEAERRIGKTSILHKMEAETPGGWETVSLDLEEVHSAAEFAEKVCAQVHERLEGWSKQGRRLQNVFKTIGGLGVGPIKFPEKKDQPGGYWKTLLTNAIEDLVEQQAEVNKRTVFLFDEMPLMLESIADPTRDGPQTAMEILDVLRGLRQARTTGQGFRMVICGSIGMHHLLANLKRQGYRNQPVNDMVLMETPPLEPALAIELATRLLAGDAVEHDAEAPAIIAEQTGGFPYYIHWIIQKLVLNLRPGTPESIEAAIKEMLTVDGDPCDFRHFKTRIPNYYPGQKDIVFALLDHAAATSGPFPQAELLNVARTAGAADDNQVRDLLRLLSLDHYLKRDPDERYRFRHALLRRWWIVEQGLGQPAEDRP